MELTLQTGTEEVHCPVCEVGRNDTSDGGRDTCFHCDTCWFAECDFDYSANPVEYMVKRLRIRLSRFYNNTPAYKDKYKIQGVKHMPKVEIRKGYWDRKVVEDSSDKVFLFGDNTHDRIFTHHIPSFTQAVIRGLPNAIGIDTKKNRGIHSSAYFSDDDFPEFKFRVDEALKEAIATGKIIVLPEDGIGTGKAMLIQKAPECYAYLQEQLKLLISGELTV